MAEDKNMRLHISAESTRIILHLHCDTSRCGAMHLLILQVSRCCFLTLQNPSNTNPPSTTVAQHCLNIGSMFCVCWDKHSRCGKAIVVFLPTWRLHLALGGIPSKKEVGPQFSLSVIYRPGLKCSVQKIQAYVTLFWKVTHNNRKT